MYAPLSFFIYRSTSEGYTARMNGTLYVVATPIGNLEDITLRALRILKEVDVVFCEDTRVTKKLLNAYDISYERLRSLNARTEERKIGAILKLLEDGRDVALVSDAGTPTISDPGSRLVRAAHEAGRAVIAIPGPSALIAALSISGLPASEFLFLGFLPHKKGREKLFKEIAEEKRTVVFYESPHRIAKTLTSLAEYLGAREIVVAREITKLHEEVTRGTAGEIREHLSQNKNKTRGEFVLMVAPR